MSQLFDMLGNLENDGNITASIRIVWALENGDELQSSATSGTAEELAATLIAAGVVPEETPWREVPDDYVSPPTAKEILDAFTAAIQRHLDSFAQTRNYDGIMSAATYAASTVQKFAIEGRYAVEMRDATWARAYEILAEVEGGSRPMPGLEEVIAELPELIWPEA